jgi:Pentapeptide repeats (9 copies)
MVSFEDTKFGHYPVSFARAFFSGWAYFKGASLTSVDFTSTIFSQHVNFSSVAFADGASFKEASFPAEADFEEAVFSGPVDFEGTKFSAPVHFWRTTFSGWVYFGGAVFLDQANFENAIFHRWTSFEAAEFRSRAYFVNTEMRGETLFTAATFAAEPPKFFGAKLHEGTVWDDVSWPPLPTDNVIAEGFVHAYERLKLEMDRLKRHEDELDFFIHELKCRRIVLGDWREVQHFHIMRHTISSPPLKLPGMSIGGQRYGWFGRCVVVPTFTIPSWTIGLRCPTYGMAISLYGFLCDYGRSFGRPMLLLLITAAVGAIVFWPHFGWSGIGEALGLSFANIFGAFGLRRDLIDPDVLRLLPPILKVISALETGVGLSLLFLFGLALRNRFRMK